MSYMSEWIYSEEELREAVKEDRDRIRKEIIFIISGCHDYLQ